MPRQELGGEGIIVQIDESVVTRRKFNQGRAVKEKWVIGMYDTERKCGVVVYVVKRDKETLHPIIQEYVKTGSIIWTDGWAAYNGLQDLGYTHRTVNHKKEFISADGVCTNAIEGYWATLKQFCRHTEVLRSRLLPEHIDEFMYRQHFHGTPADMYGYFLGHIKEKYPL